MKRIWAFWILFLLSNIALALEPAEFPDPQKFPLPEGYKPTVQFWMRVYGEWEDHQMVIHDSRNMSIIFDVIDMPEENPLLYSARKPLITDRVDYFKAILLDLDRDPDAKNRSEDHARVYKMYAGIASSNKFQEAASNLRVQQGIKDRFEKGLSQMTQYIGQIKRIFREEGMPEELAYLPLVESSFNNSSLSRTMAAGIWQ